jgi:hypothetical protein
MSMASLGFAALQLGIGRERNGMSDPYGLGHAPNSQRMTKGTAAARRITEGRPTLASFMFDPYDVSTLQ